MRTTDSLVAVNGYCDEYQGGDGVTHVGREPRQLTDKAQVKQRTVHHYGDFRRHGDDTIDEVTHSERQNKYSRGHVLPFPVINNPHETVTEKSRDHQKYRVHNCGGINPKYMLRKFLLWVTNVQRTGIKECVVWVHASEQ